MVKKGVRILFVCKYNRFRSKIAEAYFNKINKNETLIATSAGIIKGDILDKYQSKSLVLQKNIAKNFGLETNPKFIGLSISLLKKQDLIIVVADDVPKIVFNNKKYVKKVIQWNIKDSRSDNKSLVRTIIKQIMANVDNLVKDLK